MTEIQSEAKQFSYYQFMQFMGCLVLERKASSILQSQERIRDTITNYGIMNTTYLETSISPLISNAIAEMDIIQNWYVIVESWCGDSARNLPVIAKMAALSKGKITLTIFLRDKNLEFIDQYQTNGSRAIPKLISFDENGNELFTWGPRPRPVQNMILNWKVNTDGTTLADLKNKMYAWYAMDNGGSIQREFLRLFNKVTACNKRA